MRNLLALLLCVFVAISAAAEDAAKQSCEEKKNIPHVVNGIPADSDLLLVRHGYSLGYNNGQRQADWVCYILTAEDLKKKRVRRSAKFFRDPDIADHPVDPAEYNRTGYDRGHLAPAADMAHSAETMRESFFMSNISPQVPACNRGIWKRVEDQVRRWALAEGKLCVIAGPVYAVPDRTVTMSGTDIPVPTAFYKVVLDMTPPMKMIAFVIPNTKAQKHISCFVVSVDTVEQYTGCDFFSELPDELENELEKESDFSKWPK